MASVEPKIDKKEVVEEIRIDEIGVKFPDKITHPWNLRDYKNINDTVGGLPYFSCILDIFRQYAEYAARTSEANAHIEYYDYLSFLIMTHRSKGKIGLDLKTIDVFGRSYCKEIIRIIALIANRQAVPPHFTKLLQKLIDAGVNLSSDKDRETEFLPRARGDRTAAKRTLFQTPLDYAFEVCPQNLRLDYENTTWQGYPEQPPVTFTPIILLLKAIYLKVRKDSLNAIDPLKHELNSALSASGSRFSAPLINIVAGYAFESTVFHFTCRSDFVDKFIKLGRLFTEYEEAVEKKTRGENVVLANQDINDVIFGPRPSEQAVIKSQNPQRQDSQDPIATQLKNVAVQLAAVRGEQANLKQELAEQRTLFTEAFRQTNEAFKETSAQLRQLMDMTRNITFAISRNKALEEGTSQVKL